MSGLSDLLLWSALALALGLASYAHARGAFARLSRPRAPFVEMARLARARALIAARAALAFVNEAFATASRRLVGVWVALAARRSAQRPVAPLTAAAPPVQPVQHASLPIASPPPPAALPAASASAPPSPSLPPPALPAQLPRPSTTTALVRRRTRKPGECEHPIVLAHGWMAVDAFSLPGMRQEYFRGVRDHLRAHGHRVYVPRVSPFAGVRRRAEQLADQLAKVDADKVNIIAHSMGGLDARYAISRFGLADRVASLTTIGTPHHGTPLADASAMLRDLPLLQRALRSQLGLDFDAVHDLTTAQMREFNDAVPDAPGVRYASYLGCVRGGVRDVHTLLAPGFAFLKRKTGDNDGMVPTSSQRWGDVKGEVRADHWAQIGWSQGIDVKRFYSAIARALARLGL